MRDVSLQIDHVDKSYDAHQVLRDVHAEVGSGDALILRGRNGTGKSTLLRCIAGAEPPSAGTIRLSHLEARPGDLNWWREVYAVLDDFAWLPDLTVRDHLHVLGRRAASTHDEADEALRRLSIAHCADRRPATLSAGQFRRAALASTLIRPSRVLVLDEPEQRLDADGLDAVLDILREMLDAGRILVVATHSDRVERGLAGQVLRLDPA